MKFRELLKIRKGEYKTIVPVYCPCLRTYVNFNSNGFMHLRFHIDGTPRKEKEQMHKMGLLPLVIPVIKLATSAEYQKRFSPIGRKRLDGKSILKEVEYWALVASVGKQPVKVKVILRKIGNGKIHFWSVWKT